MLPIIYLLLPQIANFCDLKLPYHDSITANYSSTPSDKTLNQLKIIPIVVQGIYSIRYHHHGRQR